MGGVGTCDLGVGRGAGCRSLWKLWNYTIWRQPPLLVVTFVSIMIFSLGHLWHHWKIPRSLLWCHEKAFWKFRANQSKEYCYSGENEIFVFVFMGMSLVIMKEEKHRKHTICCESRFISNGIFLSIFHETWIMGLEGATEGHSSFSLGGSTIPMAS